MAANSVVIQLGALNSKQPNSPLTQIAASHPKGRRTVDLEP